MSLLNPIGQRFAVVAQLALMASISLGLATNTPKTTANTLSSKAELVAPAPQIPADMRDPTPMDLAIGALSVRDAALYRALFAAQEEGDWDKAKQLSENIKDKRLMGSVLADRFARLGASLEEQTAWLEAYSALPEAQTVYAAAAKQGAQLTKPKAFGTWLEGGSVDVPASFSMDYGLGKTALDARSRQLASTIQKALAQRAPDKASALLDAAREKETLPPTFIAETKANIAAYLFRAGQTEKAASVSNEPAGHGHPLALWIRGLSLWKQEAFNEASTVFARLASIDGLSENNVAAAHFWAYRALEKEGEFSQSEIHLELAAEASQGFYSLLAKHLLGEKPLGAAPATNLKATPWNKNHRDALAAFPAGWRALAFVQIDQIERAQAELRQINPKADTRRRAAMLSLASFVPMPDLAMQIAQVRPGKKYDPAFYPLPPWKPSEGFKIDQALIFALARHESLFDPMAISSRGARGLMQIMPATADAVIAHHGLSKEGDGYASLFDPTFNISLGQLYVRQLTNMPGIGNNLLLLLAAYNAGPTKVLEWREARQDFDPLLFMESIPMRETRHYVARVLPHYWAYRARLGRSLESLDQLALGKWPHAPLAEAASVRMADASSLKH